MGTWKFSTPLLLTHSMPARICSPAANLANASWVLSGCGSLRDCTYLSPNVYISPRPIEFVKTVGSQVNVTDNGVSMSHSGCIGALESDS
jgi:hypothetical protein